MPIQEPSLRAIGPFPSGANNVSLETSVPTRSFRKGVNVDVTDDGKIRRRTGRVKLFDAAARDLFGYGQRGFFAVGSDLYRFNVSGPSPTDPELIYSGLAPFNPLCHTMVEPDIYLSDGVSTLRIGLGDFVEPWSLPMPDFPTVAVEASGSLEKGRYMLAIAFKTLSGEEGPLTNPTAVDVAEDFSKITLGLPSAPPAANRIAVYMTKPNGTELLLLAVVPVAAGTLAINKQALGRPTVSQDTDQMPPGRFATVWNGRLLVAFENYVVWSEPNQYGLTKLAYNYLAFSEPVTMLAAIDTAQGFFVGLGSKTYFVSGTNPADASLVDAYSFGVIPGTQTMVPGARLPFEVPPVKPVPMWMASNGVFCVGLVDGSVQPLTETRFAGTTGGEGAAFFDQRNGINRYVATVRNPQENAFAVTDQFTAEVVRNNIPSDH